MPDSRRALGDVSNRRAARGTSSKKPANPPLRRSRRLSRDPAEDDDAAVAHRAIESRDQQPNSLNRSSQAEPANPLEACTGQRKESAVAKGKARPGRVVKRSRVEDLEEALAPITKKKKRTTSRGKSTLSDSTPDERMSNPCPDILEDGNHGLQRHPFDDTKFTAGIAKYDVEYKDDLKQASSYVTDIYQRLFNAEAQTKPSEYMELQPELNGMMRSILIDWIVEVHLKFRLIPETLYLAINIIDRYLQRERVPRKRLQLVGVTALLIACKYEEIYPPEVKDCVYITDRAYTRQDVLDMEAHIVKTLKFRMTVPTGFLFLRRFLHICTATRAAKSLANFYMERMLQEYSALKYRPSLVAATVVALSINNPDALETEGYSLHEAPGIPEELIRYSGFEIEEIKEVAKLMENKVGEVDTTYSRRSLTSVKKKYASDKYDNVSSFILPTVDHLGVP